MKHVAYWEFDPKDIETVIKKYMAFKQLYKEGKPYHLSFPKPISPSYQVGEMNGFQLFEVEDETQIARLMAYYRPEMRWEFTPIVPVNESITSYLVTEKMTGAAEMWKEIEEKLEKKRKEIEESE